MADKQVVSCSPRVFLALTPAIIAGFAGVGLGYQTGALSTDDEDLSPVFKRFIFSAVMFPISRAAFCLISGLAGLANWRMLTAGAAGAFTGFLVSFQRLVRHEDESANLGMGVFGLLGLIVEKYFPYM